MDQDNASASFSDGLSRLQKQYDLITCAVEVLIEQRAEFKRVLNEFLEDLESRQACSVAPANGALGGHGDPHAVIQALRQELEQKQAEIESFRSPKAESIPGRAPGEDIEDYENELNEFRRQLEADRQTLDQELAQLRARNAELNEAAKEAELELSKERAQLARERIELERLRAEIRQETEHLQRNNGIHERLAMLQAPQRARQRKPV
jgi:chromosome segregation ATPase